ncbi:MAG: SagB/ThcOx family dehydrogenase [Burkholderiales bacterium]|nr:SagB/ThcOx family dehydrogenase [Burkholderiales bacterium]
MATGLSTVLSYHARSKHHFGRYAAGPGGLDWATQPDPFRRFAGCPTVALPLLEEAALPLPFAELDRAPSRPRPLTLDAVAALLELAFGLSAWKAYGNTRWALRCNPSSGNLHPTEAYLLVEACPDLAGGLYHYVASDHLLERRARLAGTWPLLPAGCVLIGLTSIFWREAWKYGERAFRYCQHDAGHALVAVRYAAATLGWQARLVESVADAELAALLGIDRAGDFPQAEGEYPELLLLVGPGPLPDDLPLAPLIAALKEWAGQANQLSPSHKHDWPVIGEVAEATRKPATPPSLSTPPALPPPLSCPTHAPAVRLIRQRRSAQAFDGHTALSHEGFYRLLDKTLPRPALPPWDAIGWAPRIHLVLFVHRVEGLSPGLYCLARREEAVTLLRKTLSREFEWQGIAGCPAHLALFRLLSGDTRAVAQALACHQDIAADGALSFAMLAEFADPLRDRPWVYRQLHWEAGMVGQVLYLEAEAAGLRGTGIGCFFDDPTHELLGIGDATLQDLYHFTVGGALPDARLKTLPPYAHLQRPPARP